MKTSKSRDIGGQTVCVICDASLEKQAEGFFDVLCALYDEGKEIEHGTRIRFAWSVITLLDVQGGLLAHEPDFSGNPIDDVRPDLSLTLLIAAEQVAFLRSFLLDISEPPLFYQTLIMVGSALHANDVFLLHQESSGGLDSGWFLGATAEQSSEERILAPIHTLVATHAHLLKCLALPEGYMAVFNGRELVAVLDPYDQELKPSS